MAPVYIGLVHYPIYNKHMEVVTTALTNYDLHDIARTAKTYGVRTYFIIHPIESQREMRAAGSIITRTEKKLLKKQILYRLWRMPLSR
mgnify:CR=1 FL=1